MREIVDILGRVAEFRLHPLGFFYLRHQMERGISRRVHVWVDSSVRIQENECHQHSFDIHSEILIGRMRSELYKFLPNADGREQEFEVMYRDGESILLPTGMVGDLELIAEFDSIKDSKYLLRAGVIHRVSIIQPPCVALLMTEERHIPIFSYGRNGQEPPFKRRLINNDELGEVVKVLEGLV